VDRTPSPTFLLKLLFVFGLISGTAAAGDSPLLRVNSNYWGFSFKSTGGVMRDSVYQFDISTAAEFSHDTPKNFDILMKIFIFFFAFFRQFKACVTAWRFDRGPGDA
jgi:hypothetical protein